MKPDAILTADMHLRDDKPVCRGDDYWKAQADKILFLRKLQEKHSRPDKLIPIIDAADLLHRWKSSPYLLAWAINTLPNEFYSAPGNHDLPDHSIQSFHRSGLAVLKAAEAVRLERVVEFDNFVVYFTPWGEKAPPKPTSNRKKSVLVLHQMVYLGSEPYPGANKEGSNARALLRKHPGFDLIVTGHNHQSFTYVTDDKRLLVNPGSMMRMTADQIDFQPRVYLWYAETNTVEKVNFEIDRNAVSRAHVEKEITENERIEAFVSKLRTDVEMSLSFHNNLESFIVANNVAPGVSKMCWEALEE